MNDGTYRRLAASVLVAHQRRDDSGCLCGKLKLGESWVDHVAEVLDAAGALRDRRPPYLDGAPSNVHPDLADRLAAGTDPFPPQPHLTHADVTPSLPADPPS